MRLFGFELRRVSRSVEPIEKAAEPVTNVGWNSVFTTHSLNWQQGPLNHLQTSEVLSYSTVFACIRLISDSIAKLPLNLIELTQAGVWVPTTNPAFSPLLRRPAPAYNRITWVASVLNSLLVGGAAYALKRFDNRGVLVRLDLLDPRAVEPLVSQRGEVFYRLGQDRLAGLSEEQRTVPARFIAHWTYTTLTHPLLGCSPLQAALHAATAGDAIMARQGTLHGKRPQIYGTLSIPSTLSDPQAEAAKTAWSASTGPEGTGTVVLRNGVEFKPLSLSPQEMESVAALKLTDLDICRAFGVPPELTGVLPTAKDPEAQMLAFQNTTLGPLVEKLELGLDEAMRLPAHIGVEFDVAALYRMAPLTRAKVATERIKAGYLKPNEARGEIGLEPVAGGDACYLQQQNFSLEALARRDAQEDPFAGSSAPASGDEDDVDEDDVKAQLREEILAELEEEAA